MKKRYNSAAIYFKKLFCQRVQKISVDAGFTCPNRDGTKATGGCTYCNNDAFKPFYCSPKKDIGLQLKQGIDFFAKKYNSQKYIAYFQTFSNTYDRLNKLKQIYEKALEVTGIIGLVIATRPDCVDEQILDYLAKLSEKYFILVEFGVESTKNETLETINRQHSYEDSLKALKMSAERNLKTGIHLILGLPGETEEEMLNHSGKISKIDFDFLKIHQLQIVKNTVMAKDYFNNRQKYRLFTLEKYINFVVKFIERLSPDIKIERFTSESPSDLLIAPKWGRVKNYQIVHKIEKKLEELNTWQGKFYKK